MAAEEVTPRSRAIRTRWPGRETALASNAFTRTSFWFAGWSTNETDEVVYTDGAVVSNLTAEADGEVTLFAVWSEALPSTVKVTMPDGTVLDCEVGSTITLPSAVKKSGSLFVGRSDGTHVYAAGAE